MSLAALRGLLPSPADYADVPRHWRSDLAAGATVGIVALPLALAFGISSGAGAAAGLVTAVVAGLVAAVFGGSNVQVSGPTGAMAVVLVPIVGEHGVAALAVVGILAGLMLMVAGALRLGQLIGLVPWPVIAGFTAGIGVIIFLQQVPLVLGPVEAGTRPVTAAWHALQGADWAAAVWPLAVVAVVVALMLVVPLWNDRLPVSLLAIVLVTVAAEVLDLPLARIGQIPSSLPVPTLPSVDPALLQTVLTAAIAVAALSAIESLLSARVAVDLSGDARYNPDRELVGQGMACIASGAFGGIPATGAIARTAVNVRAGGRTRLSVITHSLVLLGVIYLASGPVSRIPMAALAAVLMLTAVRMVPAREIRTILRSTRSDAVVLVLTMVVTVLVDLVEAVQIGIAVAAVFALRAVARTSGVRREPIDSAPDPADERIAVYRLSGSMFFGAAERVRSDVQAEGHIDVVILAFSQLRTLDATGANTLAEIVRALERQGVTVLIKGVPSQHMALMRSVGVIDALRDRRHLFDAFPDALEHARGHVRRAAASPPAAPLGEPVPTG
ncbi:SulP family inorganic anion transporter [Ornithinimicrobium pekingense]|uniref:Sulfate permease n=1 Tax=Ornithinimicrobium pekingense TaxID=384677 RepID=A0ABQ2F8D9_9MICO|nr:SulP family inorganic anion transporter [Ornithinimicrobium pekingense]GGK68822.1 sulfate permease [Ornithinimicrobium pekingense]